MLKDVEELEEKVFTASLQVKVGLKWGVKGGLRLAGQGSFEVGVVVLLLLLLSF